MSSKNTKEFARQLDKEDQLSSYRNEFHIPRDENGNELIYLCGNSLGLQPKQTRAYLDQELTDWAQLGVEGHLQAKNPWMPYHEFLSEGYAKIVGAVKSEVIAMNSLTVNLHLMMVSFYRPEGKKHKIVIEADAFPSDIYAVSSQIKHHGYEPDESLIKIRPREGENALRTEDIAKLIADKGDEIALLMLGGVNYYTGQVFDMKTLTKLAHKEDICVGFDLAHAAGNVKLELHNWNVDFAVWCSYKYLNSGPGSVAGAFIHEKHHKSNLPKFAGWWGHNKENRFKMPDDFEAIESAEGWQLSNPPILSLAAIRASLCIFDEVGMDILIEKSKKLTNYLIELLETLDSDKINIITPDQRGCQVSIQVKKGNKTLFDKITKKGVVADWREPDVIRVAPVPLYNSFTDVYKFYHILASSL
ncbi:MAG: kynureninase [Flavobacteriales bacterium]|nr:kynureninase [Flavobacteriales bacterium]